MGHISTSRKPASRNKVSYVGAPAIFKLRLACQQLETAFNDDSLGCYLVGSALQRPDWRDVDVVMIMGDAAFAALFPGAATGARWESNPKWLLLTVAISDWLSTQAGLPVDFKFQPQTWANRTHKGFRDAIGMLIDDREKT